MKKRYIIIIAVISFIIGITLSSVFLFSQDNENIISLFNKALEQYKNADYDNSISTLKRLVTEVHTEKGDKGEYFYSKTNVDYNGNELGFRIRGYSSGYGDWYPESTHYAIWSRKVNGGGSLDIYSDYDNLYVRVEYKKINPMNSLAKVKFSFENGNIQSDWVNLKVEEFNGDIVLKIEDINETIYKKESKDILISLKDGGFNITLTKN